MNSSFIIDPIDAVQQRRVEREVERYLLMAQSLYAQKFAVIDVLFDLKGRAAGMYRVKTMGRSRRHIFSKTVPVERVIRFNPWLFAKYPEDSWDNTIPHEVAHYISDCLYGIHNVRPHGQEWQAIMRNFGAKPIVRGDYDLASIPIRQTRKYPYRCACRTVDLSSYRHKKVQRGLQRYRCRECATDLSYYREVIKL